MKLLNYIFLILAVGLVGSCDLVRSPDDTEDVHTGFITYPSLILAGDAFSVIDVGSDYSEPGYSASLGTEDITDEVVVEGTVDPTVANIYIVTYSVETTNELGNDQVVTVTRTIIVQDPDVANTDLSGQYQGAGFGSDIATVVNIGRGVYTCDKLLASANNIAVTFYHIGGDLMAIPDQPSPFGNVNTTSPGTEATLTDTGFQWTAFIGCCGNFGPITFDKI